MISNLKGNLNGFFGKFDVGLAVHSCGSLADLIIEKCVECKADIIVSPCCYGSIKNIDKLNKGNNETFIKYPRSKVFESILSNIVETNSFHNNADLYKVLINFSDRTEKNIFDEKNGHMAMKLVDNDRLYYLYEQDYKYLRLTKMLPLACSTKNDILFAKYQA